MEMPKEPTDPLENLIMLILIFLFFAAIGLYHWYKSRNTEKVDK